MILDVYACLASQILTGERLADGDREGWALSRFCVSVAVICWSWAFCCGY